jgi:branched-subunit amino acid aminotransferase/4-amino-4-deoxychorismate lyase
VPFDESMINRGLSIFDAIEFYNGVFVFIDPHLDRTYNATKILGAPIEKIFSKKEFKDKLENLRPTILKYFSKEELLKIEIIVSKQSNIFLRVVPISREWLDPKLRLVFIVVQYKYLLQSLKYCGRYAEPMIITKIAKQQIDPRIEECLFYSKSQKNDRNNMVLEASNSAFFVIDTKNRLWGAKTPSVLPSTTSRIIEKIAKQNMLDESIPKNEKISEIMSFGFPINTPGYKIKEMFSTSYSRLLPVVEKLIFVNVKNDKSKIIIERIEGEKDIIINKTPITDWIRERFQEEIKRYIQNKNQKKI